MDDVISRQAAIDVIDKIFPADPMSNEYTQGITCGAALAEEYIKQLPSAQPEIIRCKDCKFYYPMTRETKTGICNLTLHQNFPDDWYCAGAELKKCEKEYEE